MILAYPEAGAAAPESPLGAELEARLLAAKPFLSPSGWFGSGRFASFFILKSSLTPEQPNRARSF